MNAFAYLKYYDWNILRISPQTKEEKMTERIGEQKFIQNRHTKK